MQLCWLIMSKPLLHLRINNSDGKLVGVLDIDQDRIPEDVEDYVKMVANEVQKRFAYPVTIEL